MAIPPLILRIYADSSGVTAGLRQTVTATKAATTQMTAQYQGFGKRLKYVETQAASATGRFGGLTQAFAQNASSIKVGAYAALAVGIVKSVQAAGDLNEAVNAVNVTFGRSSGIVREWAEGAATSAGLAEGEALQAAAGFGAMLDAAGIAGDKAAEMSVKVGQLAADIGSLRNADPTEMLERMRAGLAGEAEPLRRFGVFISEDRTKAEAYRRGIAEVGATLTDAQKIQARYNIILQDSAKASGDFARTAGSSLPNQLRILRAQLINLAAALGKVLLPAVNLFLRSLNALLAPLTAIADILGTTSWERYADDLRDAGLTTEQATARVNEMRQAMDESNASGRQMGGAMAALGRQTRAAAEEAEGWAMRQRAVQAEMDDTDRQLATLGGGIRRFTDVAAKEWATFASETAASNDAVSGALDALAEKHKLTADKIIAQFNRQARNLKDYNDNLAAVARRNIPDDVLQQLIEMGRGGADIMAELAGASDRKFAQIVRAMDRAGGQTDRLEQKIAALRNALLSIEGTYDATIRITQTNAINPAGLIAGQRQHGGPVTAGATYLVGERGPELFTPTSSGTVIPNAGVTINVYGDVNDAERFERKVTQALAHAVRRAS